jgi:hypothetical protein
MEEVSMTEIVQTLNTADAAKALGRKPQTLRRWASLDCGPLRPVRVLGRLMWKVSDINTVLRGEKVEAN